jgi:drug/metabolite transporter (DMT)-like permease
MSEIATEPDSSGTRVRQEQIPLGILFMIASTIVFAASSAMTKWLVATYPPGEVLFTRAIGSLLICAVIILPRTGLAVFRTRRLHHHVMRTFTQSVSQTFLVIAFSLMPLASATAINFSAPLFTALMSWLLLKEPVGPARWSALLVGFLGVLIVTNPGAATFQAGALFALANAVMYGSVTAAVRGMTATESAATLTLYQLVLITGFFACLLPFGAIWPNPGDVGLMFVNGLTNGVGQYWWTRSLSLAPTSAVTPFYYLMLVWAAGIGFAVWGDVPSTGLVIGSAIVVASGLYLLWHESGR